MGWKSARNPPNNARDVIVNCDMKCEEYRVLVGWWYDTDKRWIVAKFDDAIVVQWHDIPVGRKRREGGAK